MENPDINSAPSCSSEVKSVRNKRTPKDFIFGKILGEGSFSTVYLAKDIHTQKQFAVKVCEKLHIIKEKKTEYINREKQALFLLTNVPYFVKMFFTFQDTKRLYFVLSYANNGELLRYIDKISCFDLECARFYSSEILVALEHLRRLNIIHRDLKPENILLDSNMHVLITDFGSSKILTHADSGNSGNNNGSLSTDVVQKVSNATKNDNELNSSTSSGVDEIRSEPLWAPSSRKKRHYSFVGTAQYVPPELLLGMPVSPVSDLWSFGCIIYQMICSTPPFRSMSEYVIFRKICKLEYEFPKKFCPVGKDLVQKLLVLKQEDRLGYNDGEKYTSIRNHKFYEGINFETLHQTTPPPIRVNSSFFNDEDSRYKVPDDLEPGLDDKQITRLLGLDIKCAATTTEINVPAVDSSPPPKQITKVIVDLSPNTIVERLQTQQKENQKWDAVVESNLILKQGLVYKKKGLFPRRRMLLLTTGPHLYYADPITYVRKGEIPFSPQLRTESITFKVFFVHTPNRTYYLEDATGYAMEWCKAIDEVLVNTYGSLETLKLEYPKNTKKTHCPIHRRRLRWWWRY